MGKPHKPGRDVEPAPEPWFEFLGFIVVRKSDLLAAVAFILAVSSAAYQLWEFARGANVSLFHPDTVYILFDRYPDGRRIVRFAGQISLTNTGATGRDAVLRDVSVTATVGGGALAFTEYWTTFGVATRTDNVFYFQPQASAHPIPVNGGSAVSQMVEFAPRLQDCQAEAVANPATDSSGCKPEKDYVLDDDFLGAVMKADQIVFAFNGTIFNSTGIIKSICRVIVSERLKRILPLNDWYAAQCLPMPGAS